MPKISVVIPAYNHAQYISEALRSVFEQTYNNFEVIVVDDGSTDNTREALEPFYPMLRYIFQENKGRSAARQKGIMESQGVYIAFLDADDKWHPEKLEKQITYIEKNGFWGLLHTKVHIIDEKGEELKEENAAIEQGYEYGVRNNYGYISLLNQCALFLSATVIPRNLILDIGGFRSKYKVREDYDMILRLAKVSKIKLIDEKLTYHRVHPDDSARSAKDKVEEEYLMIYEDQLRTLDSIVSIEGRKKAAIYIYDKLFTFSCERKDRRAAFGYFKGLIKISPFHMLEIDKIAKLLTLHKA